MTDHDLVGPPEKGVNVRVTGKGFDVFIQVNDSDDREIVSSLLDMGEKRRYSKQQATNETGK